MSDKANEYLASLSGEELTAENAAQLLELAEGDTGFDPDKSVVPAAPVNAAAAASEDAKKNAGEQTDSHAGAAANGQPDTTQPGGEVDHNNALILAKDGKHTIPYEKLAQAREGEREWRSKAEAAQRELDSLRAQAEARAADGQQATQVDVNAAAAQAAIDAGVDPGLFGDFSEEALAAGIQKLVDARVAEAVKHSVDAKLAPIQQQQQHSEVQNHYQAIYEAHPDADSIYESKELEDWIKSQPSFVQTSFRSVLEEGTTEQVVELFTMFKTATGAQAAEQNDPKAAAAAIVAKAKAAPPVSLSDIPGGAAGAQNQAEALAALDPAAQVEAMANMTPDQIAAFLDRSL